MHKNSINDNWLGWRGQNYGSIELKDPPIKWSIHNKIVWKSSIKGEGHSSPITDGKFIYITSSSKNNTSQIFDDILIILEIFLVLILFYFTIRSYCFQAKDCIVWKTKTIGANCSYPVTYMDFLFILSDNGLLSCLNKRSGKIINKKKLSGYYYSSLCRAGKYLYATNLEGETYVLEIQQDKFVEKSINILNEKVYASIAFVKNKIVYRTSSSLLLIE